MKQVKSKNRNRMTDKTLIPNTGIAKETTVSEKPRPQASH